ncbi:hypothetical protein XENTR_v10015643 [Xenopus tropicalis]|nr:hypothetical protein XENTR_v10015643 [Xenopus tropicalis]
MSNAEIWSDMYSQCVGANVKLEEGISFSKMKHKINNVMLMVKTFNMLMCSGRKRSNNVGKTNSHSDKEKVECDTVSTDCLAKGIAQHELRLAEVESVLQRNNQVSVITEQRSMFVPDLSDPELDYDRAKLQLKVNKPLLKIVKNIPHFNPNKNVLMNSDLFESHIERYDLSEEQKNKALKLWVPARISQRLLIPVSTPGTDTDGNLIHGTRRDRLLMLNYIINGENVLDIEVLNNHKTSIDDDPFTFLVVFEQIYRLVMGIGEDQVTQQMIKAFVNKFKYLDPVANICACSVDTLQKAASHIDTYRRQLILQNSGSSNIHVIREICQSD